MNLRVIELARVLITLGALALLGAGCGDDTQSPGPMGNAGGHVETSDATGTAGNVVEPSDARADAGSAGSADTGVDSADAVSDVGSDACRLMSLDGAADSGNSGTFTMPMPVPAVLMPTSSDATTDRYELTVKAGTAAMRAGNPTPIVGFNGTYPGPTIIATKGKAVELKQTNSWTENITIHNHGHKVAASSDGHPVDYIAPGKSKTYFYPNDQRAATYWYHDHAMDLTGPHVYAGLVGFYIIHDPAEDKLGLPSGNFDVPLLVQDKKLKDDNTLDYQAPGGQQGFLGDRAIVNGVETPYFEVATRKYRFRVLNGSNARFFTIGLQSGRSFQIIGTDGGLLAAPLAVKSLSIAPAERYDIVVDFSGDAIGSSDVLTNSNSAFSPPITTLMQFRVTSPSCDPTTVPAALSTITRLAEADSKASVTLNFSQDSGGWMINGLLYDAARHDVTSKAGDINIWRLVNASSVTHPFHKHLVQFNVLDIDGLPPPPELKGWKDTVQVPDGSTVRIIFRNEIVLEKVNPTDPQTFVFHCHILEHEDHRMMLQESVVP
jgi:FtsP/CotA-like multicopper oxidase with cupredoxin domain